MRGIHPHTVLVVIDPTCQRPPNIADVARRLPAGAALIAVVLWPPPVLTFNIRLLLWQDRHRTLTTEDLIAVTWRTVNAARRDREAVSGYACQYRRSTGAQHRRVADAIANLCRIHQPALLVLPDGALTDARARERVRALVPDVAITLATPIDTRATISRGAGAGHASETLNRLALNMVVCRLTAAAVAIVAFVLAMNLTALAASMSPLLGLAALPITLAAAIIIVDAVCEKLTPHAMRAVRRYYRGVTLYLRADR